MNAAVASPTATRNEWLAARRELLVEEKKLVRMRDALAQKRRDLPRVRIEKDYRFDTTAGEKSLADLFGTRSQLIIYHYMFGPAWEEGCFGCGLIADGLDAARMHLEHHDVSMVVVSRADLTKLQAFRTRMGWKFPWVSSRNCDFNYDFGVSFTAEQVAGTEPSEYNYRRAEKASNEELSGVSVFQRDADGSIYHTYSSYARGNEHLAMMYNYLDLTPNGRMENGPNHDMRDWVRLHDKYEAAAPSACCHEK